MNRPFRRAHLSIIPRWLLLVMLVGISPVVFSQTVGPTVGLVTQVDARFLYRPGAVEKTLLLTVLDSEGAAVGTDETISLAANDFVAKFHVAGLDPATDYSYKLEEIVSGNPVPIVGPDSVHHFKTALSTGASGVVTTAFASCAFPSAEPVWERMGLLGVDQLFLMGDTPYIDTSNLALIRSYHRAFLALPFLSALGRHTSIVGTWDDHDFGLNNGNGLNFAAGKPNTRQGFVEYRAHGQYGDGTGGVYHKVDLGVMEVFLLDPRWFSQTAPSPVDVSQMTCFGSTQWAWLLNALQTSSAPFKVLAMGQVWQDKKNGETDDMFTYWYERDALLDFVRDENIPGVVLLGGDIHVSRHLVHPQRVGYDLHDFITSPAHGGVIPSLNVPHPSLEWSSELGRQFLTLKADTSVQPAVLTARYILHDGTLLHEVVIPYDQLTPRSGVGLGRGLRGSWTFDETFENQSMLGSRIDANAVNGGALVPAAGLKGGAASFTRASQSYLQVTRSLLDDNSAAHSVSLWCQPSSLPVHGGTERHFLLESTLNGTTAETTGFNLSLSLAPAVDPGQVNLEMFTHTLRPASPPSPPTIAPTAIAQGPFSQAFPRTLFAGAWVHVLFTFDSQRLRLHVNGALAVEHVLPTPGPASEMGGLIIGGHRNGTGKNFDGLIDEVAVWSRVLTGAEIGSLHNGGVPPDLPVAQVEGRFVFYNRSAWDNDDPQATSDDDTAIATDKSALLSGNIATFANYTSYVRGINGIMIDVFNLPGTPTVDDFAFNMGNDQSPDGWGDAPAPSGISVRGGEGENGSDRVTIIWADNAIEKRWLKVTVKATANTGLAADDVFYFGNAIGETGNSATNTAVNGWDEAGVRANNRTSSNPGPVTDIYDINRDTFVNGWDEAAVRVFNTTSSTMLVLLDLSGPSAPSSSGVQLRSLDLSGLGDPPGSIARAEVLRRSAGLRAVDPMGSRSNGGAVSSFLKGKSLDAVSLKAIYTPVTMHATEESGTVLEFYVPESAVLESTQDMKTWTEVDVDVEDGAWRGGSDNEKIFVKAREGTYFYRITPR